MREHYVNVHALPQQVAPAKLAGSAVIVIDLLRASTTICQALASGAREVVPFLEVENALAAAAGDERNDIVLGGERFGMRIPNFDLGNSPGEYTADVVRGRRVLITTTNGTRALHHVREGRRVLIGAFVNLSAVVNSVKSETRVDVVCAGTGGNETREDILAAGAIVNRVTENADNRWTMNGAADMARGEWLKVCASANAAGRAIQDQLALELRDTAGGRNLIDIGMDRDLVDCSQVDRLCVVPELDVRSWRITV